MPITWKNISAPSFGEANDIMLKGVDRIANSINELGGIATDRSKEIKNNIETAKAKTTELAINRINSLASLEDYDQFDVNDFLKQYGDSVDAKQVRSAFEQKDNQLFDDYKFKKEYDYVSTKDSKAGQELQALINAGDYKGAKELLANHKDTLGAYGVELQGIIRTGERNEEEYQQRKADSAFNRAIRREELANSRAQTQILREEAAVTAADRATERELKGALLIKKQDEEALLATQAAIEAAHPTIPVELIRKAGTAQDAINTFLKESSVSANFEGEDWETVSKDLQKNFMDVSFDLELPVMNEKKTDYLRKDGKVVIEKVAVKGRDLPGWVASQGINSEAVESSGYWFKDNANWDGTAAKMKPAIQAAMHQWIENEVNRNVIQQSKATTAVELTNKNLDFLQKQTSTYNRNLKNIRAKRGLK